MMKHIFSYILLLSCIAAFGQREANTYQKVRISLTENYTSEEIINKLVKLFPYLENGDISLKLANEKKSLGGNHLQFVEHYKEIEVYNAGIKANINQQHQIISLLNNLKNIPSGKEVDFLLTSDQAISTLIAANPNFTEIQISQNLLWENEILTPIYKVITFSVKPSQSFEWLIDAKTGKLLRKTDRVCYFNQSEGDTTGKGTIFSPDPITKSQSVYGAIYQDNSDMHSPVFDLVTDTITLKNISYDLATHLFVLEGPFVKIEDIAANDSTPVTSPNGNFYYKRNRSGFEDVMVYYHIDTTQRYIQRLGFTNLYNLPMRADPHGYGSSDNSHFVPNGINSYLGFGQGGVDDAEDMDVIVHEYGHGLSYSGSPNTLTGTERKGLDEGIGDYVAAIRSQDISNYKWEDIFNWDGHNTFWPGRTAATSNTYPVAGGIYPIGELWSSTLMLIRADIGKETADKLFFEELYGNHASMTLVDAANVYLDGDSTLFGGSHTMAIKSRFCARNIFSGTTCLGLALENNIFENEWKIYPNPSNGDMEFVMPNNHTFVRLSIWDINGRKITEDTYTASQTLHFELSSGIYMAKLQGEKGEVAWKKWVVN